MNMAFSWKRLAVVLGLCLLASGCDPCGGPLKFNGFGQKACYDGGVK
jgi:hypothetical protein